MSTSQTHVSGMEASAISVLKRAVELDQNGRFQESLVCYQEGIQLLIDVLKGTLLQPNTRYKYSWPKPFIDFDHFLLPTVVKDDSKRERYRDKIKSYMDRAEHIKSHVKQIKEGKLSSDWLILDWFHIWRGSAPRS